MIAIGAVIATISVSYMARYSNYRTVLKDVCVASSQLLLTNAALYAILTTVYVVLFVPQYVLLWNNIYLLQSGNLIFYKTFTRISLVLAHALVIYLENMVFMVFTKLSAATMNIDSSNARVEIPKSLMSASEKTSYLTKNIMLQSILYPFTLITEAFCGTDVRVQETRVENEDACYEEKVEHKMMRLIRENYVDTQIFMSSFLEDINTDYVRAMKVNPEILEKTLVIAKSKCMDLSSMIYSWIVLMMFIAYKMVNSQSFDFLMPDINSTFAISFFGVSLGTPEIFLLFTLGYFLAYHTYAVISATSLILLLQDQKVERTSVSEHSAGLHDFMASKTVQEDAPQQPNVECSYANYSL